MSRYEREILESLARQYTLPYFQVLRARIVLSAGECDSHDQIAAALSVGRDVVSLWRKRFFYEGLVPWIRDALDKSRSAAPGWPGATTEDSGPI